VFLAASGSRPADHGILAAFSRFDANPLDFFGIATFL
jgi:hypothetical protein